MFKDTLPAYCWFITLNSWPTALNDAYLKHVISFVGHITVFLFLGALDSSYLGGIPNIKITEKTKITHTQKNVALNRPQKGHLFTIWDWNETAECWLILTYLGRCTSGDKKLHVHNDYESAMSTDLGLQ